MALILKQAVRRNIKSFLPNFMFELTKEEKQKLVTNCDRLNRLKHSSALPRVFTEQGVAMLSSVLVYRLPIDKEQESLFANSGANKY